MGLNAEVDLAVQAARRAGGIVMQYFQAGVGVETKSDGSPVTIADQRAEEELRALILSRYPADGVVGEEFGEHAGTSGRRWVLDPIDGTKAFVHGVPLFGILIGLEADGESVLGVCYFPALDEMVYAADGLGSWWLPAGHKPNEPPIRARVSSVPRLADGLLLLNAYEYFEKTGRTAVFEPLCRAGKLSRGWADCYGQALVATGRAEAMVEPAMHVWDTAPFLPIVREAGGAFTDWKGKTTIHGGDSLTSNGLVHEELLRLVQAHT